MRPYLISHLSDLHLTSREDASRSEPPTFKHKLTGMNASFRKVVGSKAVQESDVVLVTGDVTDRGERKAWEVFWSAIDEAGLRGRVRVVPGNHDVCCLGARLPKTGKGYRESDLRKALEGMSMGFGQPESFPWVDHVEERVVIFTLNSNNLGNLTAASNAMGEIGFYQLSSFASALHRYRDVPVKILALHHSPNIPAAEVEERRGLKPFNALSRIGHQIDRDQEMALQLLCIAHRIRLVLHGHLHRLEIRRVGGVRYVGAPATTERITIKGCATPGYTFLRYRIAGESNRVKVEQKQIF
jgi:3',5'-cyclic AMP phosphodiesterase CpdA